MFKKLNLLALLLIMGVTTASAVDPTEGELSQEEKNKRISVRQQAQQYCDQYIVFAEDHLSEVKEAHAKDTEKDSAVDALNYCIAEAKEFKRLIIKEKDPEMLLYVVLDRRLVDLSKQAELIRKGKRTHGCASTDPFQQVMAHAFTDLYQFMNQLILSIWQLIDPQSLMAKTRLCVRCSPQLWPILRGERDDLGHPDEAISLKTLDEIEAAEEWPLEEFQRDTMCYMVFIEEREVKVKLLGWSTGEESTLILRPPAQRNSNCPFYQKMPSLPYPDWLKSLIELEHEKCEQGLEEATKRLEAEKRRLKEMREEHRQQELQEENRRRQFLEERARGEQRLEDIHRELQKLEEEGRRLEELAERQRHQRELEENVTNRPNDTASASQVSSSDEGGLSETQLFTGKEADEGAAVPEASGAFLTAETHESPVKREEDNLGKQAIEDDESEDSPLAPLRPSGMRKFHGQQAPSREKSSTGLKGKHKKTYEKIFDAERFNTVSFGEFKALWQHICGKGSVKEWTGSSHKKLIGPHGEVLPAFSHGEGMTYTKRTIPYVRDALQQIGYEGL